MDVTYPHLTWVASLNATLLDAPCFSQGNDDEDDDEDAVVDDHAGDDHDDDDDDFLGCRFSQGKVDLP
jgi:hypothetical protein